ncbi:hypothetical protein AB0M20_15755, partial [Actinoplanes sp. NPDC051633]|uniref:hypothetical protein n=1 Tax=Actinoplanes sp. NPDC051633 TaxID=3155670 RepID=UPI003415B35D
MALAAVFFVLVFVLALTLGLYTVRGLLRRSGETLLKIAAGAFQLEFSAKIDADRDDPEVVAAPAEQEQIEPAAPRTAIAGTADDGGGGP